MTTNERTLPALSIWQFACASRYRLIVLLVVLLGGLQLSGCSEDSPTAPPEVVPPSAVPVYRWDPADFTHVLEVGPGQVYADPSTVPWESLAPSTLVRIHWRAEPYRHKWVINSVGRADEPVVVLGVPSGGQRPVIHGENATTRQALNYWNENRSVVKVGGSNLPSDDVVPAHIFIQGLEIRSGRPPFQFTDDNGVGQSYQQNAAAIHIEVGEQITIHDCVLHDCGNGLFVSSPASAVAVSGNHLHTNGMEHSIYHHNSYTECLGITFEYNHYGPLRDDCLGNNLKDRSAGTVIRYNWIEGGNRQLDLVETDHEHIRDDPSYDTTFVYGNILIEPDGAGNSQVLHYGGDGSDIEYYRRGTLHFFHNTVMSTRGGNTTLLRCATNDVIVDARNNIVHNKAAGRYFAITSGQGQIALTNNWLPAGYRSTHEPSLEGMIVTTDNLEGETPGFRDAASQDFRLDADSPCVDAAGDAAKGTAVHPVGQQYVTHCSGESRPAADGLDIGAQER
ncbi:MAG: polysaccharide-degrading enzyme [bacterium]